MKSKIIIVLGILAFLILGFAGCEKVPGTNMLKIKPPVNDNLDISGAWKVKSYKVLEENMYPKEDISKLINKEIYINDTTVNMDSQIFKNVNYKLKVVQGNYIISYQEKYTVAKLGVNSTNVITAADKNNVIFDFFNISDNNSYIYYRGILLNVEKVGPAAEKDFLPTDGEASINSLAVNENSTATGVLMGIKVPYVDKDTNKQLYYYKTLWVKEVDGKVSVEEAPDILFPRMTGMWTVTPKDTVQNGYYKQYFEVNPMNGKQKNDLTSSYNGKFDIYQSINYIGNDYIGLETYKGTKFKGDYPEYKVIPIDVFSQDKGVALEDIYNNQINEVFKGAFESEYSNLNATEKTKVNGNINYKDFTLLRVEGKWTISGKISPLNDDNPSYNFLTSIKPNSNLVRYDTLYVPWRILRADIPTIEDGYTSPDGKLAIIFIKGELLAYKVSNNKLEGKPIFRYELPENAKVVMDEWCSGDYVTYWTTSFNQYKKKFEED
ncbi:hypothetical protein [uncultured Clostridium sp.]|uniref:hypothetical protein n=1 Tax=uncultured Clostridium sp. TaxID=59620 RepID=UPI00261992C0|nr:hypothetical protein [uncultured Clostridium sp.]